MIAEDGSRMERCIWVGAHNRSDGGVALAGGQPRASALRMIDVVSFERDEVITRAHAACLAEVTDDPSHRLSFARRRALLLALGPQQLDSKGYGTALTVGNLLALVDRYLDEASALVSRSARAANDRSEGGAR